MNENIMEKAKNEYEKTKSHTIFLIMTTYKVVGFKVVEDLIKKSLKDLNVDTLIGGLDFFEEVKKQNFLIEEDKIKFNALLKVYLEKIEKELRIPMFEEGE